MENINKKKQKVFGYTFYMGLIVLLIDVALMLLLRVRVDFGLGLGAGLVAATIFNMIEAMANKEKKEAQK